jgi:hypothetical protein
MADIPTLLAKRYQAQFRSPSASLARLNCCSTRVALQVSSPYATLSTTLSIRAMNTGSGRCEIQERCKMLPGGSCKMGAALEEVFVAPAMLASGRTHSGSGLIGVDGLWSNVRKQ